MRHGLDARRVALADHESFGVVLATSLVVFLGVLLLATRRLRQLDVP